MLNFIEENKIQHLLVEKTDRLLRNMSDYVLIKRLTNTTNISVHLAKESAILGKNANSNEKLIFGLRSVMAENYLDNLSEEVKKGLTEKAAQGTYPSTAPYGYKNERIDGKKMIVVDHTSAPYVQRMFELYATGSYSLKTLRKNMLEEGMVYRNGKNFYISKIETILNNEFYTGIFYWKGKKYENATHAPLISTELFNTVQEVMTTPYKSKSKKGLFPYTNLITCGVCGCALTAEIKKGRYIYYHCTGYKGNCNQPYLRQEELEKEFTALLNNIVVSDEMMALVLHIVHPFVKTNFSQS
jgi:site-specific DNA recombinase